MNLLISEEYRKELDPDNYCIKASMLAENGVHLFIASNQWDEIRVELCPSLPVARLEFLPTVCQNIKVNKLSDYSAYIDALIALFPNKSGALRRCKLSGTGFYDVIKEYVYG